MENPNINSSPSIKDGDINICDNIEMGEHENKETIGEIEDVKKKYINEENSIEVNKNKEQERDDSVDSLFDEHEGTQEKIVLEETKTENEAKGESSEQENKKKVTKKKKKLRKFKGIVNRKRNREDSSEDERGDEKNEEKEEKGEKGEKGEKVGEEENKKYLDKMPSKKKKQKKTLHDSYTENKFVDNVAEEKDESEAESEESKHENDEDYEIRENSDKLQNEKTINKIKSRQVYKKKGNNSKEINESSESDFDERKSEVERLDTERNEANKLKKKKTHFDEILENIKLRKRKKKTMSDEECLQYCESVLKQMISAHELDVRTVKENKPATAKLQIVDSISRILTKPKWKPYFMKLNINRVLEMWLMPITKNSLPHFSIRSSILKVILQLPVTIKSLRGSQLGKVLMYLHSHKDETEENKKMIKTILQNLLGPIIGINANYKYSLKKRQKKIMENPNFHKIILEKAKTLIPERISIEKEEEQNECKRHVTVPFNSECSFLINVPSAAPIDNKKNQFKSKIKRLTDNFNFVNRIKKSQTFSMDGKGIITAP